MKKIVHAIKCKHFKSLSYFSRPLSLFFSTHKIIHILKKITTTIFLKFSIIRIVSNLIPHPLLEIGKLLCRKQSAFIPSVNLTVRNIHFTSFPFQVLERIEGASHWTVTSVVYLTCNVPSADFLKCWYG